MICGGAGIWHIVLLLKQTFAAQARLPFFAQVSFRPQICVDPRKVAAIELRGFPFLHTQEKTREKSASNAPPAGG